MSRPSLFVDDKNDGIIAIIRMPTIYGALADNVPKTIRNPWDNRAPPDFPKRDPMPSMADLPWRRSSEVRDTKAISLVASKRVYFDARIKTFCNDPIKTTNTKGAVIPIAKESRKRSNGRKITLVHSKILGVIIATNVQPRRRKMPLIDNESATETMPIHIVTWLIYAL